jgi:mycothiol synthase
VVDVGQISDAVGVEAVAGPRGPQWWIRGGRPDQPELERRATEAGLSEVRRLHQMRRPLPLGPDLPIPDLPLRSFRPGIDDDAWLRTNNRAFAWHPDQSGWTPDRLGDRMAEPWFDPAGFLLLDADDGTIAAFCWTKFHADADPTMGEVYVIGVDPDHQGRGLGRALTVAGLDWQWRHHRPPVGMLYVEHDNVAAVGLYRAMGFTTHHDDVAFERPAADATGGTRG